MRRCEENDDKMMDSIFKVYGGDDGCFDPIEAAQNFMDNQYPKWRIFEADDAFFPPIQFPAVKYNQAEQTNWVHDVQKGEVTVYDYLCKGFHRTSTKPLIIHSLKGKIYPEGTSEGFSMFNELIHSADFNKNCNKDYFLTHTHAKKKTKKLEAADEMKKLEGPDETKKLEEADKNKKPNKTKQKIPASIEEIGDIWLLFPNTICIIEIKDNDGKEKLEEKVQLSIEQLRLAEDWIQNSFGVIDYWRKTKKLEGIED